MYGREGEGEQGTRLLVTIRRKVPRGPNIELPKAAEEATREANALLPLPLLLQQQQLSDVGRDVGQFSDGWRE